MRPTSQAKDLIVRIVTLPVKIRAKHSCKSALNAITGRGLGKLSVKTVILT